MTTPTPPPDPAPDPPPDLALADRSGWWRGRRNVVLLTVAGGAVVLLGQSRSWATGRAPLVSGTTASVTLDGGSAAPGVGALALVALAAAVALATAGRAVRRAVAVLVALAGAGAVGLVLAARSSPQSLQSALDAATGTTGAAGSAERVLSWTAWPLITATGGVLVTVAAGLALRWSSSWQRPSSRYERTARTDPPERVAADPWDALSRGEDPTGGPG